MTSRDWANLPRNVVYRIAMSLQDLNMKDRFRMVCESWRSGVNPILEQRAERRKAFYEAELALMTMRYKGRLKKSFLFSFSFSNLTANSTLIVVNYWGLMCLFYKVETEFCRNFSNYSYT